MQAKTTTLPEHAKAQAAEIKRLTAVIADLRDRLEKAEALKKQALSNAAEPNDDHI